MKAVFSNLNAIEEVIVFGSRALGTFRPNSDIDFALKGENICYNDILKLYRLFDELPYGYTYDILDYKTITNPELIAHIDNFGLSLYKKNGDVS